MKRVLCGLLLCVMVLSGCSEKAGKSKETFDFGLRTWVEWGLKEGEVRAQFEKEDIRLEKLFGNWIGYTHEKTYKGCEVLESYTFYNDNELGRVGYVFKHVDTPEGEDNRYFEIYNDCKEHFNKKYGEPISDEESWNDDKYKNDEYMIYQAIEDGDYTAKSEWKYDNVHCIVQLSVNKVGGVEIILNNAD